MPRFKRRGPPSLIPRLLSPLLALDFFVLYFSGLYMLFHYYYIVTNIPPLEFKPVQVHLWASIIAVPLLAAHLGNHLIEIIRSLSERRSELAADAASAQQPASPLTRRAFLATVFAGGIGLAVGFQNTPLRSAREKHLFIGRIPKEEQGGPGDFPVETLFRKSDVDVNAWRLQIDGAVGQEVSLTYDAAARPAKPSTPTSASAASAAGRRCRTGAGRASATCSPSRRRTRTRSRWRSTASPTTASPGTSTRSWVTTRSSRPTSTAPPSRLNHGFPVRLIVPGYPGQNMVKQLDRITVRTEKPSASTPTSSST